MGLPRQFHFLNFTLLSVVHGSKSFPFFIWNIHSFLTAKTTELQKLRPKKELSLRKKDLSLGESSEADEWRRLQHQKNWGNAFKKQIK